MQQSFQVDIQPYSEKSFVIRTNPPRALEPYGGHLAPLYCKWNNNLRDPSGQGTLGGWICSKQKEQLVRSVINQIQAGQLHPLSSKEFYDQRQGQQPQQRGPQYNVTQSPMSAAPSTMRPSAGMVSSLLGTPAPTPQQAPLSLAPQQPAVPQAVSQQRNIYTPLTSLPGGITQQYQPVVVQVLRPNEGQTLQLHVGGQNIPITVESTQSEAGTVTSAIVTLPDDQRTQIQLNREQIRWQIPGFAQEHTVSLD